MGVSSPVSLPVLYPTLLVSSPVLHSTPMGLHQCSKFPCSPQGCIPPPHFLTSVILLCVLTSAPFLSGSGSGSPSVERPSVSGIKRRLEGAISSIDNSVLKKRLTDIIRANSNPNRWATTACTRSTASGLWCSTC